MSNTMHFVVAVALVALLAGCAGGGMAGKSNLDRTPDIAGTWGLTETTTNDPSGNTPPGDIKTFDIVIAQNGTSFTVSAPSVPEAPTGSGTLNGREFTFNASYTFGSGRGTYSVSGWVEGTFEGGALNGTGVIDVTLASGYDDLGLNGVRVSFDWEAAKKG